MQTYLEKGDMEKALQAAEQMKKNFQSHPDYTSQMEELAERFIWHEEFEAARDVCQSLLDKFPNHKRAVWFSHYKARSEVAMKDKAAADATVRTMRQQYSDSPDYADALSWTAHHYSEEGFHERAIELYESALAMQPDKEVELRCREGIIAAKAGMPKYELFEAIENGEDKEIERIIATAGSELTDSNDALDKYLNELAIGCCKKGRQVRRDKDAVSAKSYFKAAVSVWDRLLAECPNSPICPKACFVAGAKLDQNIGDYGKAAEYFQRVAANWPDYEYAGWSLLKFGYMVEKLSDEGVFPIEDVEPVLKDVYRQVTEDYPRSRWAEQAERSLKSCE